ncbi:MAG: ExeM/NucH family extracellular endonuclease [Opitutaceae bacterium]
MSLRSRPVHFRFSWVVAWLVGIGAAVSLRANATYIPLSAGPFAQDWSSPGLLVANDNWDGVPGIIGYFGQDLTSATDAQNVLTPSTAANDVRVFANQANPNTFSSGGVAEFDTLANPTVALQGSGTADAPHLILHLDTTGRRSITVSYVLRDIDGSADNAVQPVALQYRVGTSGDFANVPAGFVADATSGPSLATQTTAVSATLPAAAENQPRVQVRILTTNAAGNDEWVGIDDILVTSSGAGPGVTVAQSGGTTVVAEGGATDTYTVALDTAPTGPVTLTATANPQVEISADGIVFSPAISVVLSSTAARTITVRAVDDAVFEDSHVGAISHALTLSSDTANYPTTLAVAGVGVTIADNDAPQTPTRISLLQGSGAASPRLNETVAVSAVVTGFVTGALGTRDGFFLQEEDAEADTDPATSEGLFVYTAQSPGLAATVAGLVLGDVVTSVGKVVEFNGLTELTTEGVGVASVTKTGSAASLPTPSTLQFPAASATAFERFEGMRITVPETMTVTNNESLGQFGELLLSSRGRLVTPTNVIDPNDAPASGTTASGASNVAAITARAASDALRTLLLDDGSTRSYPEPTPHLSSSDPATATRRAGDTVTGLSGVLSYGFGRYRVHPVAPVPFVAANPRTSLPPALGGTVTVASFNVLNYFTTFGGSNDRGAGDPVEFARQRAKIVAALRALDADIVGLIEIQNRADGGAVTNETAVNDLVAALNAAIGTAGTYVAVPPPVAGTGTDYIRTAFIYKPARVTPSGVSLTDTDAVFQRPPLAQRFNRAGDGSGVLVCLNHFRSKASGTGVDADQGDGQGGSNATRRLQAQRLIAFLNDARTTTGENDVLIIGDLNAYAEEDPIDLLRAAGYVDLIERLVPTPRYSYGFESAFGYLDHALASASLVPQVTGAAEWHINADEPEFLDYNLELNSNNPGAGLKSTAQQALNAGTPFRSSDHDPLLVGLRLADAGGVTAPTLSRSPERLAVAIGSPATFTAEATGTGPFSYEWTFNGRPVPGSTGATLTLPAVSIDQAGLYAVRVAGPGGTTASRPAILGIQSSVKVAGGGVEVAADLRHPNGNTYDQILLTGTSAVITADPGQVTRLSFIDLSDDIVQVEFAGAGSLAVVLDAVSGPSLPLNYNQNVTYLKGHARVVLTGADEGTNVSVFSVGRANAVNQALFRADVVYDGLADLAFLAVAGTNGRFGGVRTSNASYFTAAGPTGLYAPGVEFTGPAFVGDIAAFDDATGMLVLGVGPDVRVAGGNLEQPNGRAVQVKGVAQLKFVAGTTSHGTLLPAQANQARLETDGVDVTSQIVVNPVP